MKRFSSVLVLCLSVLTALCAMSVREDRQERSFDSVPMLEAYYREAQLSGAEEDFWGSVKISLVTVSKDYPVYSWFGHQALLVEAPGFDSVMYDYGRFSFNSRFYVNFARGRLLYNCTGMYADHQIEDFIRKGRTATAVELNLTPESKKAVVEFLTLNSSREYNTYLYHYYNDNCATRIRDIINCATGGDFERWAAEQPGLTYRQQTSRILINSLPWQWLLDFLQSGNIDVPATRWDEMFLPENLEKAVLEYNGLALGYTYLTDFRDTDPRPVNYAEPQGYFWISLCLGFVLAFICLITRSRAGTVYNIFSFAINLVLGLLGTLLLFMMLFTTHDVTWWNENIIIINPLLIAAAVLSLKSEKHSRALSGMWVFLTGASLILILAKLVLRGIFFQQNWCQIVTVLPMYFANAYIWWGKEKLPEVREKARETVKHVKEKVEKVSGSLHK